MQALERELESQEGTSNQDDGEEPDDGNLGPDGKWDDHIPEDDVKLMGVTSVLAPDGTGSYEELTSKSDMECAIMKENESRYRQASHTPFMLPPLLGDFSYLGIGPHAHSIMHGKYETPQMLTHIPPNLLLTFTWSPRYNKLLLSPCSSQLRNGKMDGRR
jgi:hypothetical protein